MPELDIKKIDGSDIDAVAALWERCGLTRPWNDPRADIAFARANDNATLLVGRVGDSITASAMVSHDGHRGTVYYVSVDPEHQGRGHGRTIMNAAEAWLRQRGVWKLNLLVRSENTSVIDFYSALGYDREERACLAKWIDPSKKPASEG